MKFTEDDLKKAAATVDQAMLDALPPPEAPSPQLMGKLEKLSDTTKSKTAWKRVLSRVAACLLVALLLGGTWLSVDAEARNILFIWLQNFTDDHYIYEFEETEIHQPLPKYAFGWLPKGYWMGYQYEDDPNFERYNFSYGKGETHFSLTYFYPKSGSSYVIRPYEGISITQSTLLIHGTEAEFYQVSGIKTYSTLVWVSPDSGILFRLSGDLPEESDLIRMVESLHPVEADIPGQTTRP